MNKIPYFYFYPNNWITGTNFLSLKERGAYITVLAWLADRRRLSIDEIKKILGDDFADTWPAIVGKFKYDNNDKFYNERLEHEFLKYEKRAERNRKNGAGGGRPKKPTGFSVGFPKETQMDSQKKPSLNEYILTPHSSFNTSSNINNNINSNYKSDLEKVKLIGRLDQPVGKTSEEVFSWIEEKVRSDQDWWKSVKSFCGLELFTRSEVENEIKKWAVWTVKNNSLDLRNEQSATESIKNWLLKVKTFRNASK